MNALDILGAVGAACLRERLSTSSPNDGVARFLLDQLTGPQVAAIVGALLEEPGMATTFKVAVPRALVEGCGLPDSVVTDERTVALRHSDCDRPALLLANTDEDQGASLHDVAVLSAKQLNQEAILWVEAASRGLGLPEGQLAVWKAALAGMAAANDWTLHQVSRYVELTRHSIGRESKPLLGALGWALPALQLPRDSGFFVSMRSQNQTRPAQWRKLFEKLVADRRPLLVKQRPPQQSIEAEDLKAQFALVRDDIPATVHGTIEAFIDAPPNWGPEVAALAELEWEADGVIQIFSGLRKKRTRLPEETIQFFEYQLPDRLGEADQAYLRLLAQRNPLGEPRDDDVEFFETHREDLGLNRSLRAKWERFVFGQPIECEDLLDGLLRVLERLYGQAGPAAGLARTLHIRSARRSKSRCLDLNADVATAFAQRYRGLPELMGESVVWDAPHLFDYEALLEETARKSPRFKRNVSTSRASLQIKFDVTLGIGEGDRSERSTVQLIWTGRPNAIGLELPDDLARLEKHPFMTSTVARQPVSRKGFLQAISLGDVASLQPAFRQDSGSLVPAIDDAEDLRASFPKALTVAVEGGRLGAQPAEAIAAAWDSFASVYAGAISAWRKTGLADARLLDQAELYGALLDALARHAPGDLNRQDLWQPILRLGCVPIVGGAPSAIIAPWHPLRLAAIAVKARSVAGLASYILSTDGVNFGDSRLFFSDLRAEIAHPYYPEVAVGYRGAEPVLLAETSTLNDYSLMERPVRDPKEAATDVDPTEAARQIRSLLERYLELQPHERSNLSIMLYNCDTAGLPLATVNALGSVHGEDEMHCNVLVRHRDRPKLGDVYQELLERSDSDPDALVVSETSRNFMSKLRIGVMLEGGNAPTGQHRNVDVAFLHDVVSRQAKETWFEVAAPSSLPSLIDHVPARWSYRRVSAEDELKATNYLACPRQPAAGWSYLDAVGSVVRRASHDLERHVLPARQISFQDQNLKSMFEEVHGLAEWVATYDDLLDKRQLAAQGISVIRYRRQRTHGRNMIVSSTSELRILEVLVRRRLSELSLGITDERLTALAKRMINEASRISGDIVLRAAKRGISAGELIGLVLSRALVSEEFAAGATTAYFLLDDYAEWLGQREQGIADILAVAVERDAGGHPRLRAIVTEAKYVREDGEAEARRKSKQQLRHTVQRIDEALFGDPGRLDRDLWLSRIADLLLDGESLANSFGELESVRDSIRRGETPIELRGYSHVLVTTSASTEASPGEQEALPETRGLQEVFKRDGVRRLVKAYEARGSLAAVREELGRQRPWEISEYRIPARPVRWASSPDEPPRPVAAVDDQGGATSREGAVHVEPTMASSEHVSDSAAPSPARPESEERGEVVVARPEDATEPAAPSREAGALQALIAARALEREAASEADAAWVESAAQQLRTALLGYGHQAKILETRLTPNAALIRFMGSDRLRVEDIEARQSALLTTHGLRLVAISPLPGEIVVAVARPERQIVSLWDVWARRKMNRNATGANTSFVLGLRELDGEILYLNLGSAFGGAQQHEPHTLVAGATGSGKSVLIQGLILDIAATNSAMLAQIILIDPKMGVDYAALEELPHIQGGIVVEQSRARAELERLVDEMDRRYALFREHRVRDLKAFNASAPAGERLPMLFLVHDEFAEWMLTDEYKEAVTSNVQRLGVKARAAGIHLIFAAQRPDANVMPLQLRDNLGNRLILKVSSVGTSEIALGTKGAESLLGLGHLAARLNGEPGIVYAQAPFLSDDDMAQAVGAIKSSVE